MQIAFLLFESQPAFDAKAIHQRAQERSGSPIQFPEPSDPSITLLAHTEHTSQFEEATIPGQTFITQMDEPPDPQKMQDCVEQSWACENAADLLQRATHTLMVNEMMCDGIEPKNRLHIFHSVLQAVAEITKPHAIVFSHTQQIITATDYLAPLEPDQPKLMRPGMINVRMYNISNGDEGDVIMDTLGLDAIGLHDLQCHFRGLDPQDVASTLLNTGVYIFDQGPVIESGQTIDGQPPVKRYACQFEESILEPTREILDLNPGRSYSAGDRDGGGGGFLGRTTGLFGKR